MAVRWKRYYPEKCKNVVCESKRGNYCPVDLPKKKRCGRWLIELFDDNKRWVSLSFKDVRSKRDAERRLTLLIADRERGKLQLPRRVAIPSLSEYSKTYLELCKNDKENTYLLKLRMVSALTRYLGEYPLDKISPFIIEKYRVDRREKDKVKDSSINVDIAILSHIYSTVIKAGIMGKNPCREVKRLKITQVKDRILSQSEIALLLDRLQGKDRLMVLVGLFTGLRLGGVSGLSWHDIDFNNGVVTSSHKTGKLVTIPISDYLSKELLEWKESNSGDRVFESRPITKDVVIEYSKYFSNLFKSLGIQDFTFHNLRHTFASLLQGELNIGAVVVQGMTGHSSLSMLQKYTHTGLDNKKQAIQALTDHVLSKRPETSFAIAQ